MEFDFDINNLFGNEITVLNKQLNPYRATPACFREYKSQLCTVIDQMGVASAKAQGLHGPITSVSRMSSSEHILYVMKDPCAHKGKGAVVGFLKVGVKKLFVYDGEGTQHEIEPLCALDFYVHESRQRNGCGRRIFDHMLRTENVKPQHIAIDRPSHKFLSFLMKHYHLRNSLPQRNNFVIFDGFLKSSKGRKCNADHNKPPAHPYQRQETRPIQRTLSMPNSGRQSSSPISQLCCESPDIFTPPPSSAGGKKRDSMCHILCWQDPAEEQPAEELSIEVASKISLDVDDEEETSKMAKLPTDYDYSKPLGGQKVHHLPPIDSVRSNPPSGRSSHQPPLSSTQANSPQHHVVNNCGNSSPPSIRRDGPSHDYVSLYGPNHNPPQQATPACVDPFSTRSFKPQDNHSAWNVFGVPQTRIVNQVPTNGRNPLASEHSKYRHFKQW